MYTPEEAAKILREDYGMVPGTTVYTVLRHVSRSGMTRWISPVVLSVSCDGIPHVHDISHLVGMVLKRPANRKHDGVRVEGTGMDMGFELVYNLGRALWPYHRDPASTSISRDDPGYSFVQRWL